MQNPKWHRDEIILALGLYFQIEPSQIHARNKKIVELSLLLNKLPIHNDIPRNTNFRNANGVALKLSNFLAIDPNFYGKGMNAFSKLDKQVFDEFHSDKIELKRISKAIKNTLKDNELSFELQKIELDDINYSVREGETIYKLHKLKERNSSINIRKKKNYLDKYGMLDCEVCGFNFSKIYGELGIGFIECHHRIPLSECNGNKKTFLRDLALVCANCHRMLHRYISNLSIEELKKRINTIY